MIVHILGIFQYLLFASVLLATARFILAKSDKRCVLHQDSCVQLRYFPFVPLVNPHLGRLCEVEHLGSFIKTFYKWNIGVVDCRYFRSGDFPQPSNIIRITFVHWNQF
jgi:hypothetical protein